MDWRGRRESTNVEDRRTSPGRGGGGVRVGGAGGLGLVAVVLIGMFFGVDLTPLLQDPGAGGGYSNAPAELTADDIAQEKTMRQVLAGTEDIWTEIFRDERLGKYPPPALVLFKDYLAPQVNARGVVEDMPCGAADGAVGPFYCPGDKKLYLDTGFFTTMEQRLGAGGDFVKAYVVAHEVAHHVQNVTGILPEVNRLRAKASQEDSNALSVMVELQADCLAGMWAARADQTLGVLDPGDIEEAVNAARQIGDDTLQRAAGQRPMPHTFTHGTSAQRARWFTIGYKADTTDECDTFNAPRL